jgi:hypothetical protein
MIQPDITQLNKGGQPTESSIARRIFRAATLAPLT